MRDQRVHGSRGPVVFVDHAAEHLAAVHRRVKRHDDWLVVVATLSFRSARYRSRRLALRTTELANNLSQPLQAQTPLDTRLISSYDVPPHVNSADQSGAVPFLDIANRYILAGAQYSPQVLAGLSATQIARQLGNPSSPVARAIDGSAKVIIAAIDRVLHAKNHG